MHLLGKPGGCRAIRDNPAGVNLLYESSHVRFRQAAGEQD
jgi:hypothetical protein